MVNEQQTDQPTLFELNRSNVPHEKVLLYALGEFQARKKVLAERELALDRLRGAFKRAAEKFEIAEMSDEQIAKGLEKLGAKVKQVPSFVAKHPFRIIVTTQIAAQSREIYRQILESEKVA